MSKNDFQECSLLFLGVFFSIIVVFLFVFDTYYSPKLTEQDYYNKFCKKHFDVSCDNINLK
jgi:hypothetical protein